MSTPIISSVINSVDAQPSKTLRRPRQSYGQNCGEVEGVKYTDN